MLKVKKGSLDDDWSIKWNTVPVLLEISRSIFIFEDSLCQLSVKEVVDNCNFIVSLTVKKKALIRNNLGRDLDLLHIEGISPSVLTLAQGITSAFSLCGYVPTSPLGCYPVLVRH